MLKQSDSWKKLFGDLDSLSVAEIDKLVADIETKLKDADLKLNPVDYRALIDSLNQAKETLISKNPFKALGTFYDDYIEAKKKLAEAKANVAAGKGTDEDVKKAEADMKKAAKGVTKSIETITDTATTCGNAIASMFSDLGQDDLANGLGTAMELFGQLGNAAASVGKMMSGDILVEELSQRTNTQIGCINCEKLFGRKTNPTDHILHTRFGHDVFRENL